MSNDCCVFVLLRHFYLKMKNPPGRRFSENGAKNGAFGKIIPKGRSSEATLDASEITRLHQFVKPVSCMERLSIIMGINTSAELRALGNVTEFGLATIRNILGAELLNLMMFGRTQKPQVGCTGADGGVCWIDGQLNVRSARGHDWFMVPPYVFVMCQPRVFKFKMDPKTFERKVFAMPTRLYAPSCSARASRGDAGLPALDVQSLHPLERGWLRSLAGNASPHGYNRAVLIRSRTAPREPPLEEMRSTRVEPFQGHRVLPEALILPTPHSLPASSQNTSSSHSSAGSIADRSIHTADVAVVATEPQTVQAEAQIGVERVDAAVQTPCQSVDVTLARSWIHNLEYELQAANKRVAYLSSKVDTLRADKEAVVKDAERLQGLSDSLSGKLAQNKQKAKTTIKALKANIRRLQLEKVELQAQSQRFFHQPDNSERGEALTPHAHGALNALGTSGAWAFASNTGARVVSAAASLLTRSAAADDDGSEWSSDESEGGIDDVEYPRSANS